MWLELSSKKGRLKSKVEETGAASVESAKPKLG
jgi:hypothetical protein